MRLLVVYAHPSPESYCSALLRTTVAALNAGGHELRIRDLYAMHFDPVMRRSEWESYLGAPERNACLQAEHIADLSWSEGIVLVFPTWWYGPPAILKGWLERVWVPGVAFDIPPTRHGRITRKLDNMRLVVIVTTSGSPWWWLRVMRDPGRSLFTRAVRALVHPRARMIWLQLYRMNHCTGPERARFLRRVDNALQKI